MSSPTNIKFGILSCRTLVELYYGARMVTDTIEHCYSLIEGPVQLFPLNPARIGYEVTVASTTNLATLIALCSLKSIDPRQGMVYAVGPGLGFTIERDFLTNLDAVVQELWAVPFSGGTFDVSTREIILQPLPVDELP